MKLDGRKSVGLSSADALKKLHEEITKVLEKNRSENIYKNANQNQILPKYSLFITLLVIFGLFYTEFYLTAILVLLILILNVMFVLREEKLKRTELIRKTRLIVEEIKVAVILSKDWKQINYPHLCSPLSPCISLVWTYRDNELVNLPTALLVEGDCIVMRLGSSAPGNCRDIQSKTSKPKTFKLGDTYGLNSMSSEPPPPKKPVAVQPLPDLVCVMTHTPFIDNLQLSLEKFLDRPPTIHDRQRHTLINHYMQRYIFFLTVLVIICTLTLRAFDRFFIKGKVQHTRWDHIFCLNCVSAWISLLPLIFPLIWINLHHWGAARLETLLSIPQPLMQVEKTKASQELDTPTSGDLDLPIIPRKQVWMNYLRLLNGSCDLLSRSTNIIQVLGSISAFCCVDKKGILSWPNPTPEKVFFLRDSNNDEGSTSSSETSLNSNLSEQNGGIGVTAEVLDVTHDQNSPFKLEFDDHEWKNHLSSLKPLGL